MTEAGFPSAGVTEQAGVPSASQRVGVLSFADDGIFDTQVGEFGGAGAPADGGGDEDHGADGAGPGAPDGGGGKDNGGTEVDGTPTL